MSRRLNIALWIVQILLFIVFAGTGIWKLATPIGDLAKMIPWAGEVSPAFLYAIAIIDLAGGIGIVIPRTARLAAFGCTLLQVCAIVFHFSRGEAANTPFNFVLVALLVFVIRGRS